MCDICANQPSTGGFEARMAGFMGDDPLGGFELGEGDDLLTGLPEGIVDDG